MLRYQILWCKSERKRPLSCIYSRCSCQKTCVGMFGLLLLSHVFTWNFIISSAHFSFCLYPPDVWQVFSGLVRDGGHQPRVLRTDGGSLPVRRGSQRRSDLGYLPAGSRLPGWKASSQQWLCNGWINANLKPRVFLWSVLCISGHVQVQGWERPAVCRASQDLTLRWQTVLQHRLHLQPSCYRRPALPWVLPKGQRLHFRPLASRTHAAGNCALYFKSRTSWLLVVKKKKDNYIAKTFSLISIHVATLYMKATLAWIYSLPGSSTCTALSFCLCGNYGSSVCVFSFNSLIRAEAWIWWAAQTVCSCWKWHHSLLLKNTLKWIISLLLKRTREPFTHWF